MAISEEITDAGTAVAVDLGDENVEEIHILKAEKSTLLEFLKFVRQHIRELNGFFGNLAGPLWSYLSRCDDYNIVQSAVGTIEIELGEEPKAVQLIKDVLTMAQRALLVIRHKIHALQAMTA